MTKYFIAWMAILAYATASYSAPPENVTIPVLPAQVYSLTTPHQKCAYFLKEASKDAPILYQGFQNEWRPEEEPVVLYWSDENIPEGYKTYLKQITGGAYIPLQTSAGWYRIWFSDRPVWLGGIYNMGNKFTIDPISFEEDQFRMNSPDGEEGNYTVYQRKSGKYAGMLAFIYKYGGIEGICFGTMINGMAVFPAMLPAKIHYDYGTSQELTVIPPKPKSPFYDIKFPASLSDGNYSINLNKISDEVIGNLYRKANSSDKILVGYKYGNYLPELMWFDASLWPLKTMTVPFQSGSYTVAPSKIEEVVTVATAQAQREKELIRSIENPVVEYANAGIKLTDISLNPSTTTLYVTLTPTRNFQWNVNRDAYITSNEAPGKHFNILSVSNNVNLSPKPTNARAGVPINFTMTFESVPLETTVVNLVEGPSKDNIHINNIQTPLPSQNETKPTSMNQDGFGGGVGTAEVSPSFPGGMGAMMSWIGRNMEYPPNAAYKKITGRVMVQFVVMSDGSISQIKVVKGVDPELDAEAVRLIRAMPNWNPGTMNGKPVNCIQTVPIIFKIQ